jgi:hypothetical protein
MPASMAGPARRASAASPFRIDLARRSSVRRSTAVETFASSAGGRGVSLVSPGLSLPGPVAIVPGAAGLPAAAVSLVSPGLSALADAARPADRGDAARRQRPEQGGRGRRGWSPMLRGAGQGHERVVVAAAIGMRKIIRGIDQGAFRPPRANESALDGPPGLCANICIINAYMQAVK